jgi:hypothetical protein
MRIVGFLIVKTQVKGGTSNREVTSGANYACPTGFFDSFMNLIVQRYLTV